MKVKLSSRLEYPVVIKVGSGKEDVIRLSPGATEGPFERSEIKELPRGVVTIPA